MTVAGLVKSSLVDYPGKVACTLFVPGCNYSCFYCHNRQLIDGTYEVLDLDTVESFLKKRAGLLDGVVITGGEPTLQPDLVPFIKKIRRLGYLVKLDTNGSSPETVKWLLSERLCDYYAVDYKAPAGRYREICGRAADVRKTLETVSLLLQTQVPFEVRTTVIPQLSEKDLLIMAKELPVLPRYVLNRYRKPEKYLPAEEDRISQTPYTQKQISAFAEVVRPYQPNVSA